MPMSKIRRIVHCAGRSRICQHARGKAVTSGATALIAAALAAGLIAPAPAFAAAPSGPPMPVGDLPGWHQIFTDNFAANVPLGSFPAAVASKWTAYSGFADTSGHGTYDPAKVISISNGVMTLHLHTENGTHYVS